MAQVQCCKIAHVAFLWTLLEYIFYRGVGVNVQKTTLYHSGILKVAFIPGIFTGVISQGEHFSCCAGRHEVLFSSSAFFALLPNLFIIWKKNLVLQGLRLAPNSIPFLCRTCQPESLEWPSIKSFAQRSTSACPTPSSSSLPVEKRILFNHHALRARVFPLFVTALL